jgi:hypothetical protein
VIERLVLAFLLQAVPARDSAYLAGRRLLIEPLGMSFRVPPVWLGMRGPGDRDYHCGNQPEGRVRDRIVTDPARLRSFKGPAGEWRTEFSAVIDSVLPFANLVAQLGGDPWRGSCGTLQMRVYVGDRLGKLTMAADAGVRTASRYFQPVSRSQVDSAGWHITRLSWNAMYHDYGGTAQVEFWTRPVRGRDVVLVFMFTGKGGGQFLDRTDIVASIREQSPAR